MCYTVVTLTLLQDTCTAFLLGGIGELNATREANFLVVKQGELISKSPECRIK